MLAGRFRQKCRPILVDTSNITNLYAHVVKRLSPRKLVTFDLIAIRASSLAC